MKILGVESSATAASAAVLDGDKILSLQYTNTGLTHSETLMPMIERALQASSVPLSEIDLFAVSAGPGSFTGVRIGVASVKGMALPLQKPCIGVSTLEVIAAPLMCSAVCAVAVMDARCKQVYTARFLAGNGALERISPDEAISVDALGDALLHITVPKVLIGDGAELVLRQLRDRVTDLSAAPPMLRYQNAASVALVARDKFSADPSCAVDAAALLPVYLRVSQAERELKKKQNSEKVESK